MKKNILREENMTDANPEKEIASLEAKAIIQKAQDQVAEIITKTTDEIARRVDLARESGMKQGHEKAAELKIKLEKLESIILSEMDDSIISTALGSAHEVLSEEIKKNPEYIVDIVQTALRNIPESAQIWLRVNPRDVDILIQNKKKIIEALERVKDVDIREDRQVARGGVLIQTESGVIDAQIQTQLDEMSRILGV
ncbi:MAG: FliH/SctL family protein [bacterium]|nr:FliH/SctL family protein [bacterium]